MTINKVYGTRQRIGEGGKEPFPIRGSLSTQEAVSAVRRLGFVAAKMHEAIMSNLLSRDDASAEMFNDAFKPLVEALIHFEEFDADGS